MTDNNTANLGLATTRTLLEEIEARIEISRNEGWRKKNLIHLLNVIKRDLTGEELDYRTVNS